MWVASVFTLGEIPVIDMDGTVVESELPIHQSFLAVFRVTRQSFHLLSDGYPIEQGDTIVAFLTVINRIVAHFLYLIDGKQRIFNLGFLEADNIWRIFVDNGFQLVKAGSQSVYVKRNDIHVLFQRPR